MESSRCISMKKDGHRRPTIQQNGSCLFTKYQQFTTISFLQLSAFTSSVQHWIFLLIQEPRCWSHQDGNGMDLQRTPMKLQTSSQLRFSQSLLWVEEMVVPMETKIRSHGHYSSVSTVGPKINHNSSVSTVHSMKYDCQAAHQK